MYSEHHHKIEQFADTLHNLFPADCVKVLNLKRLDSLS